MSKTIQASNFSISGHPQVPELPDRFKDLKKELIHPENKEKLKESYEKLLVELDKKMEEIHEAGSSYVPEIDWEIMKQNDYKLPEDIKEKFMERGCLIVRKVVDAETVSDWFESMKGFTEKHPEIGGYPLPNPTNWFAYWTKGEVQARSHPEIMKMMRALGQVWNYDDNSLIDTNSQVVYADSFRIRYPGKESSLLLHLDSGSMERWEDPGYRSVYQSILDGNWEDYDAYCLDARHFAKSDLYVGESGRPSACSCFRSLQGWLSLSDTKEGEGTIRFLPDIKLVTAYILLRPFFWKDDGELDLDTSKFPGAIPGSGQFFPNKRYFPHLQQEKSVIGIPDIKPGDYVLWHCDLAHEVDKNHPGDSHSSVFYNAQVPLCVYNIENMIKMRENFQKGVPPPDFISKAVHHFENEYSDNGAKKENILTDDGLRAMGYLEFDENEEGLTKGEHEIRKIANQMIADYFK